MTSPPYECPTRTIGPLMLARTLATYAESLATPRSGFAGARTVYPRSCSRVITPLQPEASAKAPWIRTIVGLGPLSSCALTAVDLGWPPEAPVPAKRITPAKADSTTSRVLLSLGVVVELRMCMTASSVCLGLLGVALDESKGRIGNLAPATVDDQCVAAVGEFDDLGYALIALLLLVGSVRDRPGNLVVLGAVDEQEWSAVGVLGVDLRLGPWVDVRGRRLEERHAGCRHGVCLVQLLRFVLADGIRESVAELVVSKGDGTIDVERVAEDGRPRLQRRERQRKHATEGPWVDRHRCCREAASGDDLNEKAPEGMPNDGRLVLQLADHLCVVIGDLSNRLVGENLGMSIRLFDGVWVIGPPRLDRRVAGLVENRGPSVPAAGQQPEAVDEDHGSLASRVCILDLSCDVAINRNGHRCLLYQGPGFSSGRWRVAHRWSKCVMPRGTEASV